MIHTTCGRIHFPNCHPFQRCNVSSKFKYFCTPALNVMTGLLRSTSPQQNWVFRRNVPIIWILLMIFIEVRFAPYWFPTWLMTHTSAIFIPHTVLIIRRVEASNELSFHTVYPSSTNTKYVRSFIRASTQYLLTGGEGGTPSTWPAVHELIKSISSSVSIYIKETEPNTTEDKYLLLCISCYLVMTIRTIGCFFHERTLPPKSRIPLLIDASLLNPGINLHHMDLLLLGTTR